MLPKGTYSLTSLSIYQVLSRNVDFNQEPVFLAHIQLAARPFSVSLFVVNILADRTVVSRLRCNHPQMSTEPGFR